MESNLGIIARTAFPRAERRRLSLGVPTTEYETWISTLPTDLQTEYTELLQSNNLSVHQLHKILILLQQQQPNNAYALGVIVSAH